MSLWRRGLSYAHLGSLFSINILLRTLRRALGTADQAAVYRDQYRGDGYVELPEPEPGTVARGGACTSCNACTESCPAMSVTRGGSAAGLPLALARTLSRAPTFVTAAADSAFLCNGCGRCESVCPESIPIAGIARTVKASVLSGAGTLERNGMVPPALRRVLDNVRTGQTVLGRPLRPFREFQKKKAEWVVFLGCVGHLQQRTAARRTLSLLERLGVDFTTIEERCSGGPLADAGILDASFGGVKHNLEAVQARGTNKVLFQCPNCMLTMQRHAAYGGKLITEHLSSFLLTRGLTRVDRPLAPVAYHDACRMGRGLGLYQPPRHVLAALGMEIHELDMSRERSECAGFGGELPATARQEASAAARARLIEARSSGVRTLVTECWGARHHLRRTAFGAGLDMRVATVAEMVAQTMGDGAPTPPD